MGLQGIRVLVVDDDRDVLKMLRGSLSERGCTVETVDNGPDALEMLRTKPFEVCLVDLVMPEMDGLELLGHIRRDHPGVEVILITGHASVDSAVDAMKRGAADYIRKPFKLDELSLIISRIAQTRALRMENGRLREQIDRLTLPEEIVGESRAIQEVRRRIGEVSPREVSVLIRGETGTGKGLVARWIHYRSGRRYGPFVEVNCGSLPEGVVESELFGHEKGAFTGARERHLGRFELAEKGTVFLDDMGNLDLEVQRKLLRVLQEGEFERVGREETIRPDVRVICASNQDLEEGVRLGRFREDLYYRIAVVPIALPPLRERGEDVVLLAEHYLRRYVVEMGVGERKRFSEDALDVLRGYGWPGNVRELQNVIQEVLVFHRGEEIGILDTLQGIVISEIIRIWTLRGAGNTDNKLRCLSERSFGWIIEGGT